MPIKGFPLEMMCFYAPRKKAAFLVGERRPGSGFRSPSSRKQPGNPKELVHCARLDALTRFLSATGSVKVNVVPRSGFGVDQILPP